VGRNDCENPQPVCPREPGEGYEKCQSICKQAGHAEREAVKAAGSAARGGTATLTGHYWMCEPCGAAIRDAGIEYIRVVPSP
jgi:pyrimidine deaminase RibD-like protein